MSSSGISSAGLRENGAGTEKSRASWSKEGTRCVVTSGRIRPASILNPVPEYSLKIAARQLLQPARSLHANRIADDKKQDLPLRHLPQSWQFIRGNNQGSGTDMTSMLSQHTLPIPSALLSCACAETERRAGQLPLARGGFTITGEIIAATLEELNAEATRTLALSTRIAEGRKVQVDGLDRHLAHRGFTGKGLAAAIAEVLIQAGIAQTTSITDRRSRKVRKGIRLLPGWTWTIASVGSQRTRRSVLPYERPAAGAGWTDLCPVCREGMLEPVTGERLYGIPLTDFFTCTSCGAKFVPDSGKFRLVAIARKGDPLLSGLLNRTHTPEEWQAIARCSGSERSSRAKSAGNGCTGRKARVSSDPESGLKMTVELGDRTLYFSKLPLIFRKGRIHNLFLQRRDPVSRLLQHPAFRNLEPAMGTRYQQYLDLPAGAFVYELKERGDPFFRRFLNPHGDHTFCSFRAAPVKIGDRRGVYLIACRGGIRATGAALHTFRMTVDTVLGAVTPQSCYPDGDPEQCRINHLLCSGRDVCGLFVCPLGDEDETRRAGAELAAHFPDCGAEP